MIAEPHFLVQMDLKHICENEGAKVVTANDHAEALAVTESPGLNSAIIDYSLAERIDGHFSLEVGSTSLASRLIQLEIPFIFCSARNREAASRWSFVNFVEKPFYPEKIIEALAASRGIQIITDPRSLRRPDS